jgi:transposase
MEEPEMISRDVVKEIRKATRRKFNAEEKIRIVLGGLRGEISVSEVCRREGIAPTMYYRWSKSFLDAGKNVLTLDTRRDATSEEIRRD